MDLSSVWRFRLSGRGTQRRHSLRWRVAVGASALCTGLSLNPFSVIMPSAQAAASPLPPIKHVWLIILENKSYDATFTGLNKNTYLWQTLPSQGALLKNYYGTGHFSLDNYLSLVSGQATMPATQNDCPVYADAQGSVVNGGTDNGQFAETGAPYASSIAGGANEGATHAGTGCVYPASVQTLFNQFDSSGVSWKGYAQDLGNPDSTGPTHDVNACGGPGDPTGAGVTNPGSANSTDQYVPKHFPFPWFDSLLGSFANGNNGTSADCNPAHEANLFSATNGLYHDLQSETTTPDFSWITPNNCSDAHDAVCAGNNLSGGFSDPNTPNPPTNYTGGLYAADLFLEHVIPEIEASPAFKDNGLIDVTFDEANPPFANSSFNNATEPANASTYIASDAAGENINGVNVATEPAGPNTPLGTTTNGGLDASGDQLYPGPGDNAFIDRPSAAAEPGIIEGGAGATPGARTDTVTGGSTSLTISDPAITAPDAGRTVTGTNIPAGAMVGPVSDTGPVLDPAPTSSGNKAFAGSFQLVDSTGAPLTPTGAVTSITLGAETEQTDPLFDATDATPGGGDTGSVLISPYILPGTVSTTNYNHYSWLRTMEDLFKVDAHGESPGLDGLGHLGFAAQTGLTDFGTDVFTDYAGAASGGYLQVGSDGGVFAFGNARYYGSEGGTPLNKPVVGITATPDGRGYWQVASDGGVFAFGDATFYGSEGGTVLNKPIVGITSTPDGGGYWEVASDGGVFAFGDATFYGSEGGTVLNKPIVGISATPDGRGYWQVASDGGVFAFGDATFYGSEGGTVLNKPIVGITSTPDGGGYWEVASDGGVFTFGDAPYEGSNGGEPLSAPIVAIVATPGTLQ